MILCFLLPSTTFPDLHPGSIVPVQPSSGYQSSATSHASHPASFSPLTVPGARMTRRFSHLYDSRMFGNSSIDGLCKHPTAGIFRPATMATRVPNQDPTSLHHSFPTLGPEGGFHSTRKLGATDECQAEALTNAQDGQLWGRFGPCGVARASSPACPLFLRNPSLLALLELQDTAI